MRREWRAAAALAVVAALSGSCGGPAAPAAATWGRVEPVRIMPLGDSITGAPGCWRAYLWDRLRRAGFADGNTVPVPTGTGMPTRGPTRVAIDFVGTRGTQTCPTDYPREYPRHDGDNEGHGSYTAERMVADNELPGWLARTRPHVVLMHLGTNDVWRGRTTEQVLASYTALVAQLRASDPAMVVLVAQLIPLAPAGCRQCGRRVVALNRAIPGWAAATSTPGSPVIVVDQWTGFDPAKDTSDGVHPVWSGNEKIADRWFAALAGVLH